jgi:hypothetical protein
LVWSGTFFRFGVLIAFFSNSLCLSSNNSLRLINTLCLFLILLWGLIFLNRFVRSFSFIDQFTFICTFFLFCKLIFIWVISLLWVLVFICILCLCCMFILVLMLILTCLLILVCILSLFFRLVWLFCFITMNLVYIRFNSDFRLNLFSFFFERNIFRLILLCFHKLFVFQIIHSLFFFHYFNRSLCTLLVYIVIC